MTLLLSMGYLYKKHKSELVGSGKFYWLRSGQFLLHRMAIHLCQYFLPDVIVIVIEQRKSQRRSRLEFRAVTNKLAFRRFRDTGIVRLRSPSRSSAGKWFQ